MTPWKAAQSVAMAEKKAMKGNNESQDSQAVLAMLMIEHGIGVLSSSPTPDDHESRLEIASNASVGARILSKRSSPRRRHKVNLAPHLSSLPYEPVHLVAIQQSTTHEATKAGRPSNPSIREHVPTQVPSSPPPSKKPNMEPSQSPTQSNHDRSYDQYEQDEPQSSHNSDSYEHRTLNDDDTGAVRFDLNHTQQTLEESIPVDSEDLPTGSQAGSHGRPAFGLQSIPQPETPATLPKLLQRSGNEQLMGSSQLFGQTQYTSAVKKASPTSSRPSPNIYHHNNISPNPVISSPLKDRGLRTSPTQPLASSPAIPGRPSRPSDVNHHSPRQSQDDVADEFNIHLSRAGPEPISEYRSSRDSGTHSKAPEDSLDQYEEHEFDSYDPAEEAAHRSHLAKLKRIRADKVLTSSSPSRDMRRGDSVEVPSTNRFNPNRKQIHHSGTGEYHPQSRGRYETEKDNSQETVADSQDGPAPAVGTEFVYAHHSTDEAEQYDYTSTFNGSSVRNRHEDVDIDDTFCYSEHVFKYHTKYAKYRRRRGTGVEKGSSIEQMIRQQGGRILESGFNELFEFDSLSAAANPSHPVMSSSLKLLSPNTGFAALIADGHSRKVKYMQALALGLPCLAPRWITTCVAKRKVVDWSSYLLCAGQSAVLGEAIRSRNLLTYDASTAKLAEVISKRPRLLEGTQILLVMKKTKNEDKRQPYVFLAQVLGGSLVRVNTLEEARAKLFEQEARGEPFDWVYLGDHIHNAEGTLFGSGTAEAPSRKRKRRSAGEGETDRPPKKIRSLNDELVVQSLILGRLVEEGEMDEA
ncbi:hypothetical protein DL768_002359 [Monosporascus sp. mg162]|nr:hypothetical protein DL768_002359 [Monosporascus sp. mg162]